MTVQASDYAVAARSEVESLAARVAQLEAAAPYEGPSLLFVVGLSVGATLLTVLIVYLVMKYVCGRGKKARRGWEDSDEC